MMMPDSRGLTRGYMPYQDPVYSQPKKLPATHFHNAACGPPRKLIYLCRRCTMMLPVLHLSHFVFCMLCFFLLFLSGVFSLSHLILAPYLLFLFFLTLDEYFFSCLSSSHNPLILSFSIYLNHLLLPNTVYITHQLNF